MNSSCTTSSSRLSMAFFTLLVGSVCTTSSDQPQGLQPAIDGGVEHLGDLPPDVAGHGHAVVFLVQLVHLLLGHVQVAGALGWGAPMSAAPCTLFCPRRGFTPTPRRPMFPVIMARSAICITVKVPASAR